MQLVLEQHEVVALVKEALASRGMNVDNFYRATVRANHQKNTIRLVLSGEGEEDAPL
jgi:hypothetical protein